MNSTENVKHKRVKSPSAFACRICRRIHPLKYCWRFRNMNITERMAVIKKYGYCSNCLAHSHSQGTCFTKTGCGYCHKRHHSLLHMHPKLQESSKRNSQQASNSTSTSPNKRPTTSRQSDFLSSSKACSATSTTSLTAILQQNVATLLPTALVMIEAKDGKHYARCLLDSAARNSCIAKRFVDKLGLTTLELDKETICPLTLWSSVDPSYKIDATLRVNNRITTITPKETLPSSIKSSFQNFVLADKNFYQANSIDMILGVDIYSRVITEGIFIRSGLPTAQNTSFGIILYGTFST